MRSPIAADSNVLVFIDGGLDDVADLVKGVSGAADVILLDPTTDGLDQIVQHVSARRDLDAIHIFSHGSEGQVQLGKFTLDTRGVASRASDLAAIGNSLGDSGDILIYGCDAGRGAASGQLLIERIADYTRADVAASTDATGAISRGGDWDLESRIGNIEAALPWQAAPAYDHLLATVTLNEAWRSNGADIWSHSDNQAAGNILGTADSIYFNVDTNAFNTPPVEFSITSSAGAFNLDSITVRPFNDANDFQFEIYPTGNYGAKVTSQLISNQSNQTIVITTNLLNITSFTVRFVDTGGFQGSPNNMDFLSFVTSPANAAPTISNLNGDSVGWAGAGNSVSLDSGGNANLADADLDALNSGNGDWGGASLSVQRSGTAISSDTFGFNTPGALFTVSGGNLQSGGLTFATFTNTGGVLSISFTSSGTAATSALVDNVVQRITYRNDTPAGDATIRFTLGDGIASATADVTVTSDSIFVTNTTDTSTIDRSNGVSFSEAVAIAAADATGSQTIAFAPSLAATTLTINSVSLNESLQFDMDAASGISLSSGTITFGAGTTQGFSNGSGDTALIASTVTGSGALAKAGNGSLTLSSTSNNSGWSGAMGVTGGVLTAGTSSNPASTLANGALTLDGGALAISVTGAAGTTSTFTNNVVLGVGGGTFSVGGGGGANIANFSGTVSGGNLTKTAAAILQLSGSNTYSGTTTISAGTLRVAGDSNLGSDTLILGGGILSLTGASNIDNAIQLGATSTVDAGAAATLSGSIAGTGGLTKSGASSLTLSGTNTYTGTTQVSAGALVVTGSTAGPTTVNAGTLAGGGTLGGAVTVNSGATLSPGLSPGSMTINGNLDMAAGSTLAIELAGTTAGSGFDQLVVNGSVSLGGATLSTTHSHTAAPGDVYAIIANDAADAVTGTFSGLAEGAAFVAGGNSTPMTVSYVGGSGNDVVLAAQFNSAPTDISLSANSINESATAAAAVVGTLDSTDADTGDSHTYSLVANGASDGGSCGAAGDDDNASFQVDNPNAQLETAGSLAARSYHVCVQTSDGTASFQKTFEITVNDDVAPTVNSVAVPVNATYVAGQDLDFTIATSENVIVDTAGGTPQLALTIGATTRQASFVSGSGTTSLLFRHTVVAGDVDTNGITIGALSPNGGTLRDAAGNNLNTVLNSVGSTANVNVDASAPVVTSVSVPADATYLAGQNLDFTVNADENITVATGGGTPRLALTIGASTRYAVYNGGTGTSAIVFRYTVQAGDADSDGIAVGALESNGGTLRDASGNDLVLSLNGLGSTAGVLVDALAPSVSSVSVPANARYGVGQHLDFAINASEDVTVVTAGGTPRLSLTIGASTRFADYFGGSGTAALQFRYTVQVGDEDNDGISIGTLQPNGGTLRDSVGNDLATTLNAVGATGQVRVDGIRPTATLMLSDTSLSAGETATLTVTFSEAVSGLAVDDLTVANGTLGTASTSDGGVTWTATLTPAANTSAPSNVVTLALSGVQDAAGNTGTGSTDSPAYAVQTTSATTTILVSDSSLIIGETATVTVTFSEAVTGFEASDLVVGIGSVGAPSSLDGGVTWTTTLTPTADAEASAQSISLDNALVSTVVGGNPGSGTTVSNAYAVDTRRPTAAIAVADDMLIAGETSQVTITFSEAVTGLTPADLSVANGTLSAFSSMDGGVTWAATLTPTSSITDATNVLTLDMAGVADVATNPGSGSVTSNIYAIDTARPLAVLMLSDTTLTVGETATLTITFSEPVTGFDNADLTVPNGSLSAVVSSDGGVTWTATLTPAANTSAPANQIVLANTGVNDAAGNTGIGTTMSNSYAVQTSSATTTVVVADSSLIIGETSAVTITFSEAVSGLDSGDLTVANGSLTAPTSGDGGLTWSATLTPSVNVEAAGNLVTLANSGVTTVAGGNPGSGTTASNAYSVDTRRPTAAIVVADATLTAGETSAVTITFSEAVSGFDNADLTVPNGTLSAVSSVDGGLTWAATLSPAASTTVPGNVITLATSGVSDLAGNAGAGTTTSNAYAVRTGSFTVGGQLAGLSGSGLVLRNNGADDLAVAANGSFVFATPVADAANYLVSVATQPASPDQVCTVTRGSGSISSANVTDVQVDCVLSSNLPSAPRNVSGTPGDRQITVQWEAPQFDGGSPITGYLAQAVPQGVGAKGVASCSTTGALSCVVSGLSNGTAYTLQVSASNANGSGVAASGAAAVTPLGLPGAPTGVLVQVSGGQATISWVPPVNTGGAPISSYTVTASPGGQSCTVTGTPPPNSCQIAGLQAGVAYTFTVVARNAAGAGTGGASGAPTGSAVPAVIPVDAPWALGVLGFCLLLLTRRQLASRPVSVRRR